jgi:hypothetical protein
MTMSSSMDNGRSIRWTRGSTNVTFVPMQADPLFEHHLRDRLERLSAIGVALSAERDEHLAGAHCPRSQEFY